MATVVRVKRRCDDEPIEAFILNSKRRKISEDENTVPLSTTVFKFAGTLEKDEDIISHFDAKHAEESQKIKNYLKKHIVNIEDKLRTAHKETSKKNRFKIVNRFRSQTENITDSNKVGSDKSVTVLDLEKDLEEGGDDKTNSEETNLQKYVYDLYYNHSNECKGGEIEDYISVHPVYDYLSKDSIVDNDELDDENDSEDSNAENNWRNDYPDETDVESDVESINEKDMIQAMKNVDLDDDLLSSDEGNDFLYSVDDDDEETEAPDKSDVMRYGRRYAMFKAKYNKVLDSDSDSEDDIYD